MEYYSASKRKEILTHDTTWRNLDDIMLMKISQSTKHYKLLPNSTFIRSLKKSSSHRMRTVRGGEKEERGVSGYRASDGVKKKFWRWWWWLRNDVNELKC